MSNKISHVPGQLTPQSETWLRVAKQELKERVGWHLTQRLAQMEDIINAGLPRDVCKLTIEESIRLQIFAEAKETINGYMGTKKLAQNKEKSQQSVNEKARTWWNRTKSYKLGASFFAVICFYLLHNFIAFHCSYLSGKKRLIIFIDIFQKFLKKNIKFHRTKPKPLILQQCFLHGDIFKDMCMEFVYIFGDQTIQWEPATTMGLHLENGRRVYKYIKDKNRSGQLSARFLKCLQDIKSKIAQYDDNSIWLRTSLQRWRMTVSQAKPRGYDVQFLHPLEADTNTTETEQVTKCDAIKSINIIKAEAGNQNENQKAEHKSEIVNSDQHFMEHHYASNTTQHTQNNVDDSVKVETESAANYCMQDHVPNNNEVQNRVQSVSMKYGQNIYSFEFNQDTNKLSFDNICEIDDDYTRCHRIQIPPECKCECSDCNAAYVRKENEFDYRQFQSMHGFASFDNRIHRTYPELEQDIHETSERTLRLLQHLQSLWLKQ